MIRAFALIETLIVVGAIVLIAAFLWPVFARVRSDPPRLTSCDLHVRQISLGFLQYGQDFDGRFPPARLSASIGWADAIFPYVKNTGLYQCDKGEEVTTNHLTTDYFYNRRLAVSRAGKVKNPASVLLMGDGQDNGPAWNSWNQLPADASTNFYSPAQRHLEAAFYCFVDGHVQWLRPVEVAQQAKWSPLSP